MKKYLAVASLFLVNNEVMSWIALAVICGMALVEFLIAAEAGGAFK